MLAFHNDPRLKQKYLERVQNAQKFAPILPKTDNGWNGTSIRESLDRQELKTFPHELGIPYWLARSEEMIYCGLSPNERLAWASTFLNNISPGDDLDKLKRPFGCFLLNKALCNIDCHRYPEVEELIEATRIAPWPMPFCVSPRRQARAIQIELQKMVEFTQSQKDSAACWATAAAYYILCDRMSTSIWSVVRTYDETPNQGFQEVAQQLIKLLSS